MPNRILKESIKRSPQIDSLSWFEEIVFYRMIVTADDYGCLDGRPVVLKHDLFPTKESITTKAMKDAVNKLAQRGLVTPYEIDGQPYLYLTTWEKHQRLRKSKHKYPAPPPDFFSRQVAANRGEFPPESESELESESESNPNLCAEPQTASAPDNAPVFQIPLNNNSFWPIDAEMIAHWRDLYPAVDVKQEIRKMIGWCEANPAKRKTARGVRKFINGWLAREQDKYKSGAPYARNGTANQSGSGNVFLDMLREEEHGQN